MPDKPRSYYITSSQLDLRGMNLQNTGLSNLVFSSILILIGSPLSRPSPYPHHSIVSNSCRIRARVYSTWSWPKLRPRQILGPMLKGRYCVDSGVHVSHREGFHSSASSPAAD